MQDISSERDVQSVRQILLDIIYPKLKLWEYFVVDSEEAVQEFTKALQTNVDESLYHVLSIVDIENDVSFSVVFFFFFDF